MAWRPRVQRVGAACLLCIALVLAFDHSYRVKNRLSVWVERDNEVSSSSTGRSTYFAQWSTRHSKHVESVFAVVAVTSAAHIPERRHWQRVQWKRSVNKLRVVAGPELPKYIFKFCIGGRNLSREIAATVQQEQQQNDDLLLLDSLDYDDAFWGDIGAQGQSATTTKVVTAVRWATQHYRFQYLIRLGDDSYFRPENFFRRVRQGTLPSSLACIGYVTGTPWTYTTPAGSITAPYASGMGFAFTYDVASWISKAGDMLLAGGPEDGIVGTWFAGTRIQMHHVPDGFRDLDWECRSGEDILVHCLRDERAWALIDSNGDLPCSL